MATVDLTAAEVLITLLQAVGFGMFLAVVSKVTQYVSLRLSIKKPGIMAIVFVVLLMLSILAVLFTDLLQILDALALGLGILGIAALAVYMYAHDEDDQ